MSTPSWLAQVERPVFEAGWIVDNLDRVLSATLQHLSLTAIGVLSGIVVSFAVAVVCLRSPRFYSVVLAICGVLYTIPSLAAFALLVPFVGFSLTAAVVPLVTYTLLILVKNMVDGIAGVDRDVVEAAQGMGYRPARLLWTVQLPLALPVIIAGIRVATVTVIGLVTVTALISYGGLGQLILSGFRVLPPYPTQIIIGTVASVLLAVTLDVLLLGVERVLTPWTRRRAAA